MTHCDDGAGGGGGDTRDSGYSDGSSLQSAPDQHHYQQQHASANLADIADEDEDDDDDGYNGMSPQQFQMSSIAAARADMIKSLDAISSASGGLLMTAAPGAASMFAMPMATSEYRANARAPIISINQPPCARNQYQHVDSPRPKVSAAAAADADASTDENEILMAPPTPVDNIPDVCFCLLSFSLSA